MVRLGRMITGIRRWWFFDNTLQQDRSRPLRIRPANSGILTNYRILGWLVLNGTSIATWNLRVATIVRAFVPSGSHNWPICWI